MRYSSMITTQRKPIAVRSVIPTILNSSQASKRLICSNESIVRWFAFLVLLALATSAARMLSANNENLCSISNAKSYTVSRKGARVVLLGPGVANGIHLRVLLERISGIQTTSLTAFRSFCLHSQCAPRTCTCYLC